MRSRSKTIQLLADSPTSHLLIAVSDRGHPCHGQSEVGIARFDPAAPLEGPEKLLMDSVHSSRSESEKEWPPHSPPLTFVVRPLAEPSFRLFPRSRSTGLRVSPSPYASLALKGTTSTLPFGNWTVKFISSPSAASIYCLIVLISSSPRFSICEIADCVRPSRAAISF